MFCLSTTVRNDTLQDNKEQRVSIKCRKQLRVEELEMVSVPEYVAVTVSVGFVQRSLQIVCNQVNESLAMLDMSSNCRWGL